MERGGEVGPDTEEWLRSVVVAPFAFFREVEVEWLAVVVERNWEKTNLGRRPARERRDI